MSDKKKGSFARAFLFDLRKTLTGKFSIGLVVAIVVISALAGYFYGQVAAPSSANTNQLHSIAYYQNGTVHFSVLATNQYGGTVAGLPISIGYNNTYYNGTSNSHGYFNASASWKNVSSYNYTTENSIFPNFNGIAVIGSSGYNSSYGQSLINIWSVSQKTSISNRSLATYEVDVNNTIDFPLYAYAFPIPVNGGFKFSYYPGKIISLNGSIYLGEIASQGYQVIPPNLGNNTASGSYFVVLVNSTHALYGSSFVELYSTVSPTSITTGFIAILSELFAFLIPLLAIFSAYLYYGKDKTNGTMESILPRPVTRGRLISSRFIANVITSLIAIGLGVLVIDVLSSKYTGILLPGYQLLELIWAYFVIAAAFIGLVYLITQLTKSTGVVLGISIVFYIVLVLFWTTIFAILVPIALGYSPGTLPFAHVYFIINSFSPIGYANLVTSFLENSIAGFSTSALGVTFPEILVIGIIWAVLPFGAAYFLARNRDWVASN